MVLRAKGFRLVPILALGLLVAPTLVLFATPWPGAWALSGALIAIAIALAPGDDASYDWRTGAIELLVCAAILVLLIFAVWLAPSASEQDALRLVPGGIAGVAFMGVGARFIRVRGWGIEPLPLLAAPASGRALAGFHLALGAAGVAFAGLDAFQQIVLVAPLFEESVKFGLAVLWARFVGKLGGLPFWIVGLAAGAAFGLFEHVFTYSTEGAASHVRRVAFHAGTAALSCAWYSALMPVLGRAPAVGWAATAPSVVFHALNNFIAFAATVVGLAALPLFFIVWMLPVSVLALSVVSLVRPRLPGELTARGWRHFSLPMGPRP